MSKVYILNDNPYEKMDLEEAMDWLKQNLHFNLDYVVNVDDIQAQQEMIEILLEAYFYTEEIEDEDEDEWENDIEEREREYRKAQGF